MSSKKRSPPSARVVAASCASRSKVSGTVTVSPARARGHGCADRGSPGRGTGHRVPRTGTGPRSESVRRVWRAAARRSPGLREAQVVLRLVEPHHRAGLPHGRGRRARPWPGLDRRDAKDTSPERRAAALPPGRPVSCQSRTIRRGPPFGCGHRHVSVVGAPDMAGQGPVRPGSGIDRGCGSGNSPPP